MSSRFMNSRNVGNKCRSRVETNRCAANSFAFLPHLGRESNALGGCISVTTSRSSSITNFYPINPTIELTTQWISWYTFSVPKYPDPSGKAIAVSSWLKALISASESRRFISKNAEAVRNLFENKDGNFPLSYSLKDRSKHLPIRGEARPWKLCQDYHLNAISLLSILLLRLLELSHIGFLLASQNPQL